MRPSILAVGRLMTSANLLACATGTPRTQALRGQSGSRPASRKASPARSHRSRRCRLRRSHYGEAAVLVLRTAGSSLWQHTLPFWERRSIEAAERIHNVIKTYRLLCAWRQPRGGPRFDCTRVGCPGRQDRALFFGGQIGVPHHVLWMIERRCGVEKRIQFRVNIRPQWSKGNVPHIRPPSLSFCQCAASANMMEDRIATANSSPMVMGASVIASFPRRKKTRKARENFKRGLRFAPQQKRCLRPLMVGVWRRDGCLNASRPRSGEGRRTNRFASKNAVSSNC
jgi:hypothetical protein